MQIHFRSAVIVAALISSLRVAPVEAQQPAGLIDASLEDLMNVKVTSVSKKEQQLFGTASAIYVLTSEDIRRSGVTSLPEALRLVPGVNVARTSGGQWQISARGFTQQYANKLLVLVDGVSVYDPVFGGVNWGTFEPPIEDVDRVEVIRGPGASVWGANAVNGVINIITKHARLTQGAFATVGAGNVDLGTSMVRYGGAVSGAGYYRIDIGGALDGALSTAGSTRNSSADRHMGTAGVRMDLQPGTQDAVQVQASTLIAEGHESGSIPTGLLTPPYMTSFDEFEPRRSTIAFARWTHTTSPRAQSSLQAFATHFVSSGGKNYTTGRVVGLELQNRAGIGRHDLTSNASVHWITDRMPPTVMVTTDPERHDGRELSAFVQDDIALPGHVVLTAGSKVENTDRTTFEIEPSVRLAWRARESQTVWLAASRAARTPGRYSQDSTVIYSVIELPGVVGVFEVFPNRDLRSEHVMAYEAGYRVQLRQGLTVDTAFLYNRYERLIVNVPLAPLLELAPAPHLVVGSTWSNAGRAVTRGIETLVRWQVRRDWLLDATYTGLHARFEPAEQLFEDPSHQWNVGSRLTLATHWEADARLYFIGRVLGSALLQAAPIDSYARLDARLGRSLGDGVTLSLAGQNLTNAAHIEASTFGALGHEIPRSVYAKLTWQF